MIIFLKQNTSVQDEKKFRALLSERQIEVIPVERKEQKLFVVIGRFGELVKREVQEHPQVSSILEVNRPYKLASRNVKKDSTVVKVNGVTLGREEIIIMAGPCSVETKAQIMAIAMAVKGAGCQVLRGGAFKPRTAPYDFQGLGKIGLHFLKEAGRSVGLPVVTEVMDVREVELVEKYTDIFQIGARNMQNYSLLKEVGRARKPVLLKRGMWATYRELLLAAEYILLGGNDQVMLCERGIKTYVQETRFTLDLSSVAYLKHETHLPIIVDPSHAAGRANLVRALSRAAIAVGADGLLIEAHLDPRKSISDADQAISTEELAKLVKECKLIANALGRK